MDFSKIVYYINQGGPGVWIAAAYVVYSTAPKVVAYFQDLLATLKSTGALLTAQNELLSKFIEKVNK